MPTKQTWLGIGSIIVGLAITIGGAFFISKLSVSLGFWEPVAEAGVLGVGASLMIAGILAFIVDRPLKEAIARDAFRQVMGWATPERLKDELQRVYEVPFIAIEHRMTLDLSEPQNGITRMRFNTERTLKNESLRKQKLRPRASVRWWQDSRRMSEITEISASLQGEPAFRGHEPTEGDDAAAIDLKWAQLKKEFTLDKKEELTVIYRGYEDKLQDDMHWEVFISPTVKPIVTVNHPASLAVYVQFNSRGDTVPMGDSNIDENTVSSRWELRGTMLPIQPIIIRWWRKDEPFTPHSE